MQWAVILEQLCFAVVVFHLSKQALSSIPAPDLWLLGHSGPLILIGGVWVLPRSGHFYYVSVTSTLENARTT